MKLFKVDYSFYLLVLILIFSPKQNDILKILLCLFFHELGHLIFVLASGYNVNSINVSGIGIFMELKEHKNIFFKDLLIYSGGILINLLLMICFNSLKDICKILIMINIIPVYPLDGFNFIKSVLSYYIPYYYSSLIMDVLGVFLVFLILIYFIVIKKDFFIIINCLYLLYINIKRLLNFKLTYKGWLLNRYLNSYDYNVKNVTLFDNIDNIYYKYFNVNLVINETKVKEKELLKFIFEK